MSGKNECRMGSLTRFKPSASHTPRPRGTRAKAAVGLALVFLVGEAGRKMYPVLRSLRQGENAFQLERAQQMARNPTFLQLRKHATTPSEKEFLNSTRKHILDLAKKHPRSELARLLREKSFGLLTIKDVLGVLTPEETSALHEALKEAYARTRAEGAERLKALKK